MATARAYGRITQCLYANLLRREGLQPLDDFDMYRLFKVLHVLSVTLLAGGIAIETAIGPLMARAKSVQELRAYTRLGMISENFIMLPSLVLIIVFGYLTADRLGIDLDTTWILIGQILTFSAAVITIGVLRTMATRLHRKAEEAPDGPVPPELAAQLKNPVAPVLGATMTAVSIFIVYLMVAKPGW